MSCKQSAPPVPYVEEFSDLSGWTVWHNETHDGIDSVRKRERVSVLDGVLRIETAKGAADWESGALQSKREFLYGRVSARIRFSGASGVNEAFWMRSDVPLWSSKWFEVDIAESHGVTTCSLLEQGLPSQTRLRAFQGGWRVYSVSWGETVCTFQVDGETVAVFPNSKARLPSRLILSTAAVRWAGAPEAGAMEVDWVRVDSP